MARRRTIRRIGKWFFRWCSGQSVCRVGRVFKPTKNLESDLGLRWVVETRPTQQDYPSMTGSFLLLATTIGSALLIGFIPALLGRLRPALAAGLEIPEPALDRLKAGFSLSLIPLMLCAGWAVDHWGDKEVLFAGNLLAALGIAALGMRPSFHSLIWVVLTLGAAVSCLTCAALTLMPVAFWGVPADPTEVAERAASLNLG